MLLNIVENADELIQQGWLIYKTPLDIRILDIPLTEIIWGFAWGALLGPFYKFINGLYEKRGFHCSPQYPEPV